MKASNLMAMVEERVRWKHTVPWLIHAMLFYRFSFMFEQDLIKI